MPLLNPKLGIDFSAYVAERTRNFTGREWVFEAIQNWLVNPNGDRFFLLTGEPGIGKTAIAARLAQFAQGSRTFPGLPTGFLQAVHFCSARDSVWTDPKEFARSLALQLAQSIPEFGLALKDVGEKTNNINVDLTVGTAQNSTIQGVVIQNLTLSGLTGQEAFTQVVVNPLRQIQQEGFSQPVTILVDSLDEALTHDGESTIVGLLSKLSADVKLRLVLTSRNEGRVKDKLDEYEELFLSASEHLEKNQQDVRAYINAKFSQEETLQSSLQTEALDQAVLINSLIEKSEGNFLYVRFLLESVALGQQSFANLDGLPQGLDELYYSSLGRVVELGKKGWSEVYAPVMGVLLAAQEGLTESQIRAFTKLKESVVWDCLNDLQQFLDEIESEDEETLYKLYHQSVTDFLGKRQLVIRKKNRYYLPGQEQHQRLLEYYRPEGKPWNEVQLEKIDLYGRRHLAQHLVKGDHVEELHTLLWLDKDGKNAWFHIKDEAGDTTGFLADVKLAWELAEQNWTEATLPQVIERQCRYALIISSLVSLSDIPTELFKSLVKAGLPYGWTSAQGLAYARQIPEADKRCISLEILSPYLPDKQQEMIWQEALDAAIAISNESVRVNNLKALAPNLPPLSYEPALAAAQNIQYQFDRVEVLIALAARFPAACEPALIAIRSITDFWDDKRAEFLCKLAVHLPPSLYEPALAAAQEIQDKYCQGYRARALCALAAKFPATCESALEAAQEIQDKSERAKVLVALSVNYPTARKPALAAAKAIQDVYERAQTLIELAAHFPAAHKPALAAAKISSTGGYGWGWLRTFPAPYKPSLNAVLAIKNEDSRAKFLIDIAAYLPESSYEPALHGALDIKNESERVNVLRALASYCPEALYKPLLEAALNIKDESRGWVLIELAAHFPAACEHALKAAQAFQAEFDRAWGLIALAAHFPDAHEPALKAAQEIQDESERAKALGNLADHFPEALEIALTDALLIPDKLKRGSVLNELAINHPTACKTALAVAQEIQDESSKSYILSALATNCPSSCELVLKAAQEIQDESSKSYILSALVAICQDSLYEFLLKTALTFQDKSNSVWVLVDLAKRFPDACEPALAAARENKYAGPLVALAAHLPDACEPALKKILANNNEFLRANELCNLAVHCQSAYELALAAAQAIENEVDRANVLRNLASHCSAASEPALDAAIAIKNEDDRAECLSKLPAFFPQTLYEPLLAAAQTFEVKSCSATFLSNLAIYFPTAYELALETALAIKRPFYRANVLNILAAHFPPARELALAAAKDVEDEFSRINVLSNLAAYLDQPIFESVLASIQNNVDNSGHISRDYRDVLIKLAAHFPEAYEPARAVALDDFPTESIRAEALMDLVLNLPKPLSEPALADALAAALAFKYRNNRCSVLRKLIPELSNLPISKKFAIWQRILRSSAQRKRQEFLSELELLVPLIANLGGHTAGVAVVEVIQQVTKWWK